MRSSTVLYAEPPDAARTAKGRPRKYGDRCGSVTELATSLRGRAQRYTVQLYGKDVRKLITDEALSDHFLGLWPHLSQPPHKSFIQMLMRMVA
ncbi:hypothetical protein [Acidithiobacillus concretivorus]|uniref:Uncharacterized protein n=1 Tax=Acidithiobacillus concretivorus TaxID=3063952 RepID=A0ABS5ZS90_9PROT|nr:hypothetical protein [Acidithiobacillus concretivorus]MBU2739498.1 hypothetical protein [Acidithiobacillus concretivorus]